MSQPKPDGYLALPPAGKGSPVLVLHAWWGLNDAMKEVCDRLAKEGFVAFAPDLFAGKVTRTIEEAEQHLSQWDEEEAVPPILLPAVEELSKHPAVTDPMLGVVGFSMGAYWALWLGQKKPELARVVVFYGTDGGDGNYQQSKAAYLGHFAENDPYESPAGIQELEKNLKSASRPTTFYTYPGTGHWFFEKDRPQYNPQAASLAWERTLAFLRGPASG